MVSPEKNPQEEFRHERKFLITDYSAAEVKQFIKRHFACFSEIYHKRQINNIYFDTLGFDSYYGNVDGDTHRSKARIRWYDTLFGEVTAATLEFKIKAGLLGTKESYKLLPFTINTEFSKQEVRKALTQQTIPERVKHWLLSLQPVLLNSYHREYFLSADKLFRITIDTELRFYRISYHGNTFLNKVEQKHAVVLELKYDAQYEEEAKKIGLGLPFQLTKNSKYVQGIENVLF
jgi:SPX domain protein involved in polyphosphate accumulation